MKEKQWLAKKSREKKLIKKKENKLNKSTVFNDAVVGISANSEAKLQLAIYYLNLK